MECEDGTRSIVEDHALRDVRIRLPQNPKRIIPAAINIEIANAKSQAIMHVDAHNRYPSSYVLDLVAWRETTGVDNIGGVSTTHPVNDTCLAHAIAIDLSHHFGVSNPYFRIGVREPSVG